MDHRCKGKRTAEQVLPKYLLADYPSSEEEPETSVGVWSLRVKPKDDESSSDEEEPLHVESSDEEPSRTEPKEPWRTAAVESSDEEPWRSAEESSEEEPVPEESLNEETVPEEETIPEELPLHVEPKDVEPLSVETLKDALPWARYQGVGEERFTEATQQMGGNPLFQFDFSHQQ